MYKVMLVDDEMIIREGLKTRIDWQAYGFELAGDYANGLEAQTAIVADPPDLIISDICMPFVDGLELAEFVHHHYPDIKMIILTGFDEFEYARRAIRLKVSDFILKPVTAKEIRELLKQIKLEMDDQRQLHHNIDQLHTQWSQSLPLLKERFWEKVLTSGVSHTEWEQHRLQFALPSLSSAYQLVVIEPDNDTITDSSTQTIPPVQALVDSLSSIIQTILPAEWEYTSIVYQSRYVYLFSCPSVDHSSTPAIFEQITQTINQLYQLSSQQIDTSFTIGLATGCTDITDMPQQYEQAMQALEYRFLFGTGTLLSFANLQQQSSSPIPDIDWEKEIVTHLSNNDLEEAQRLSAQMAQQMITRRTSPTECILQFRQIALRIQDWLQQLGLGSILSTFVNQPQWLTAPTLQQILQEWFAVLDHVSAHLNKQIQINSQQHIQKAIYYIEQHYAEAHLSLQDICSHVLMSTSSFSQAFKQYTEVTYVEYLTRIRIDKAKQLLRLTEYKFYQIAEKVGYTDPNYFSSSFKKHTGITPKQYREQHRHVKELYR
ncbi:helix-turn-helix domain-containing protein [Paenibacillus sp. KACC 21273]|uniref:response regulator transcription factor n=1 Tax=Paenibacillus sp. KACC 21273 TaxID=3025665 RepID=UPI0023655CAB|nr:helix-turn-helix domain-containing protein [Paenibacillus sp. KACC 21273]WDF51631.1 helix-turn-helix domain-containing protein [Paenibacillus sp. KACC 21273]